MAHDLFGKRFIQREANEQPAWHGLGTTYGPQMAVSALDAFGADPYIISLQPLITSVTNPFTGAVTTLELEQRSIMRWPTPDEPEYKNFGIVGPEYHLLTPEDVCRIWDKAVGRSISTYGVLAGGSELFITIEMPGFDVAGEEHKMYLVFHSPWNGLNAYRVFQTPVRVVCRNTLNMALAVAGESFKINHTAKAEQYLARWMAGIYERAEARTNGIQSVLQRFAEISLPDDTVDELIERAFPLPNRPTIVPDREVNEKREKAYAIQERQVKISRERVKVLYEGMGWGLADSPITGTLNALYNAGCEAADWSPAREGLTVAYDSLFGKRADAKIDMFNVAYSYAGMD